MTYKVLFINQIQECGIDLIEHWNGEGRFHIPAGKEIELTFNGKETFWSRFSRVEILPIYKDVLIQDSTGNTYPSRQCVNNKFKCKKRKGWIEPYKKSDWLVEFENLGGELNEVYWAEYQKIHVPLNYPAFKVQVKPTSPIAKYTRIEWGKPFYERRPSTNRPGILRIHKKQNLICTLRSRQDLERLLEVRKNLKENGGLDLDSL